MDQGQDSQIAGKLARADPFFELIESAYRVFASPKPHSVEVCTECCMSRKIEADFFSPSIDRLPLDYVQEWFGAAYDPGGISKETWAYLLPRILEILAAGEDASRVAKELSLSRFDTGNPDHWSKDEWAIIDRFQRMHLDRTMKTGRPDSLDSDLCMFRLAGWPLPVLLEQVEEVSDEDLAQCLWRDWIDCPRPEISQTPFWDVADGHAALAFFTSPTLYSRMVGLALADETAVAIAAKAAAVAELIEMYP